MCLSVGTGAEFHFKVEEVWKQNRWEDMHLIKDCRSFSWGWRDRDTCIPTPPTHTQKKRQVNGQEKQGYQQENKGMNKRTSTSFYVCVLPHFWRLISPLSSVHWQVYFLFADPFVAAMMTVMKMTRSSSHKNLQIMEREHSDDDRLLINTIQKIRAYTTDQPWSDMNPHPTHVLDLTSGYTVQ